MKARTELSASGVHNLIRSMIFVFEIGICRWSELFTWVNSSIEAKSRHPASAVPIAIGIVAGVLFFGTFFCTSKRKDIKQTAT